LRRGGASPKRRGRQATMDSRNVGPTAASPTNVDKEKFMTQIDTLTTMLTSQTMKLMEAEKNLVDQKEKYMKEIGYLTDLVCMQQKQLAPKPNPDAEKLAKCMKEIAFLHEMLQLKVTGSVASIPATPGAIGDAERKHIQDVDHFWFGGEEQPGWDRDMAPSGLFAGWMKKWFSGGPEMDKKISERFTFLIEDVGRGQYKHWEADRDGRLATIILTDQFSRNCFRRQAKAFSFDKIALRVAKSIY